MKSLEQYNDILSAKELAEFLNVSVDFIRKSAKKGFLPYTQIGSKVFFSKKKLIGHFNGNKNYQEDNV